MTIEFKNSLKSGFSFGLTSGVITTLGLMVGLHAGTHSKPAVLGAILTIAVADAFSDALGMHISQESENQHPTKEIWQSTLATLLTKFFFALTFIGPVLFFSLTTAVIVSVIWGLLLLGVFSFYLARQRNVNPGKVITEHLLIALVVIAATRLIGEWIGSTFT